MAVYPCIDLAFANPALLPQVTEVSYLARGISNHTPLQVVLTLTSGRRSGVWRLHPGLGGGVFSAGFGLTTFKIVLGS